MNTITFKINKMIAGNAFTIGSLPKKINDKAPTSIVQPNIILAPTASK